MAPSSAQPLADFLADLTPYFVATCGTSSEQNPSKLANSNHNKRRAHNLGAEIINLRFHGAGRRSKARSLSPSSSLIASESSK